MPEKIIRLDGADQLREALKRLGPSVQKEAATPAVRQAAVAARRDTRRYANALFTKRTGRLLRSIRYKKVRQKHAGRDRVRYIVFAGLRRAPHAHLLEDGTASRSNKRGANRGALRPYRFMERSFNERQAYGYIVRGIDANLDKAVAKVAYRRIRRKARGR